MSPRKLIGSPKLLWILAALPHLLHAQTVTLSTLPNPSAFGAPVVLTARTPLNATGRVTFYDGLTVLGTGPVMSGTVSLSTILLPAGNRRLTAYYSGDGNYAAATSSVVVQTVIAVAGLGFVTQSSVNVLPLTPSQAVVVGDFNGDGKADFAIPGTGPGGVLVALGNGDGTFQTPVTYPAGTAPFALAMGDFNGDGKADLAVTNFGSSSVSILLGNGDGTFQPALTYPAGSPPGSIAAGDFNGDGKVDLAIANQTPNPGTVSIWLGNGDGTFRPAVNYPAANQPSSVVVGDFDGDGKADLAVGSFSDNGVQIVLGNGDGTFRPPVNFAAVPGSVNSLVTGDFNGDGKPDLAASNGTSTWILLNLGGGAFLPPVTYSGGGPVVGDFNGDGVPDLALTSLPGGVNILLGNLGGSFQSLLTFPIPNPPIALAVADFNGDGRTDLAVTSFFNGPASSVPSVTILLGVAAGLSITATGGSSQSTMAGTPFSAALQVTVLNHGAPVSGATVTFTAPASGASAILSSGTAVTNAFGAATITATANAVPGSYVVTASYQGGTAAFSLTNTGMPASLTASGGTPQFAAVGTSFANALQATVKDAGGNPVSGVTVLFIVPASGASAVLSSVSAMTNSSGVASVTAMPNGTPGSYSVIASVGTLSATFSLTNVASGGSNLALGKLATQSSTLLSYATTGAAKAVDGNTDGNFFDGSITHTNLDTNAWWQVDLGVSAIVNSIMIWNRTDCCSDRLSDYWVFVSNTPFNPGDTPATLQNRPGTFSSHQTTAPNPSALIMVGGAPGRYVRVQLSGTNYLSLAEVQVFGSATSVGSNLALGRTATQSSTLSGSSTAGPASAVDGNTDGNFFDGSVTHTNLDTNAWWQVDLGASALVNSIVIYSRTDCCSDRLNDYWVFLSDIPFGPNDTPATLQNRPATFSSHQTGAPIPFTSILAGGAQGRYVRVQLTSANYLSLAEVQVIGISAPASPNLALGKSASQSSTLPGYASAAAGSAVDGNQDGNFFDGSVTHTNQEMNPWWQVDLGVSSAVNSIVIWNRTDCCGSRLGDYWVFVSDTPFSPTDTPTTLQSRAGTFSSHQTAAPSPSARIAIGAQGRYVRVQLTGTDYLSLAEVQVIAQ